MRVREIRLSYGTQQMKAYQIIYLILDLSYHIWQVHLSDDGGMPMLVHQLSIAVCDHLERLRRAQVRPSLFNLNELYLRWQWSHIPACKHFVLCMRRPVPGQHLASWHLLISPHHHLWGVSLHVCLWVVRSAYHAHRPLQRWGDVSCVCFVTRDTLLSY